MWLQGQDWTGLDRTVEDSTKYGVEYRVIFIAFTQFKDWDLLLFVGSRAKQKCRRTPHFLPSMPS